MQEVPDELKIDSKYLTPKSPNLCMGLYNNYREASIFPNTDENLDNMCVTKAEKIYVKSKSE
jgi:hypothetical protein